MKFNHVFKQYLNCSDRAEVFQYLQDNLTESLYFWDYFVNWDKVFNKFRDVEINLNLLNYLVGKDNIEEEFRVLLREYPKVASIIPILLACRDKDFKILHSYTSGNLKYKVFNFKTKNQLTEQEITDILEFTKKTKIIELFKNKLIKNIPDYVLGIEVGLDSNGRKNRSGRTMETIVESLLLQIQQQKSILLISQATSEKIRTQWGISVKVDKSSRRFDFAVKNDDTLYLIETNYYGGRGSKLKATAGEYRTLFNFISSQGHKFIWITDGIGWKTTLRPLEETFSHIDYILNLKMVSTGLLSEIISQKL
ncbi:MAG: type II restriction endonuclease [Prochloraceae cyanobacterium]|nr:type II restriction endonuclease [Prochloraceae cyanobacterium]